ncbi:ssDNA-binding domain-containing protein [Xenorhabdus bovienii]|uniref:ArdC family protein n=1 Tax=Xenorhabdus bovienii TaxID=40576 RepID=UPI0023B30655|nr:zincin-like metallopeptidase domain-containing protein [Xenorhabdus bovienii]MDE9492893.1 ssDNA-binding domain-containing protein [Xenorhabdus bovienii]MDE9501331.1 ssDNA-binding domain-containing protein [Xenorhabdus bovienii]MDE9525057.1 ssDNA-binding domain-containing protein [Xenorhabdus bovienii]MDE9568961.1 ssDNA-binding domain-containing protein [Xenorhabdus bovienii]
MKKQTKMQKKSGVEKDIYQQVTDRIISALEKGTAPWKKPWRSAVKQYGGMLPTNALTGNHYNGVNILLLWMAAEEMGSNVNRWLTYRQAQQLGGQVRKGERSTLTVIFKPFEIQAKDKEDHLLFDDQGKPLMEQRVMLKANPLFNVTQCDGLPECLLQEGERIPENTLLPEISHEVHTMLDATGVQLASVAQDRAFYSPARDRIVMPLSDQFFTESDYWSTLLHEMVHSTGHVDRLNREGITLKNRKFGDPIYSFEELVAEMGSAFLCAQLEVFGEVNHESYIDGWLSILKADKKTLFRACKQAREASEFLLSFRVAHNVSKAA